MKLSICVVDHNNSILVEKTWENEVFLAYRNAFEPGDKIKITSSEVGVFLFLTVASCVVPSLVYLTEHETYYQIPFGDDRKVFPPHSFDGERHYIHVRVARPEEVYRRRNLALNPAATHCFSGMYPFASANVETRGEMVFAAKNAIDGVVANDNHGKWPYTSWGINRDPEAALKLEFGRDILADELVVYLRADFPHDAWWESADVHFSDGTSMQLSLKKTHEAQRFTFPTKRISWLVIDTLIKADDPSPFPALTQLEVWGTEVEND